MKLELLSACALLISSFQMPAAEPEWGPSRVKDCNRECLVGFMDGYMTAIYQHDPKAVPPLAIDLRMTENTGHMDVGEGVLWRNKVEPTPFRIYVADPVTGQVAVQARLPTVWATAGPKVPAADAGPQLTIEIKPRSLSPLMAKP